MKINIRAVFFMVAGAMSFAIMSTLVKLMQRLPAFELVFFRSLLSSVVCITLLIYLGIPMLGNQRKLLVARSLSGLIAMVLFFTGLQQLQLGDTVSLRYLSPVFAMIFAFLFLKESIRKVQWFFIFLAFLGVLILKGFGGTIPLGGLVIMLLCAVFSGIVYVLIRFISHKDHFLVIIFYFMTISTLVGGLVSIFTWVSPAGIEWLWLFLMSLSGLAGQIFMTLALQGEEANRIVPLKYSEVVFTLISGVVFFNDSYNVFALTGIALIISALMGNLLVRRKLTPQELRDSTR